MKDAPIRLLTLGAVSLEGPDREACARVLAQPRRLGLLVFLAARPAGEGVSRDRILATFWPEQPAAAARANLRNSLYFLRKALGADRLVTRGPQVVVPPTAVDCDASRLLTVEAGGARGGASGEAPGGGRAAGEAAGLLDLYRGEFLDGLHVSDAPDFEHWVDRVRAALRARASDLAWRLAADAESAGEWITAAGHARRAVELAVDVEGAAQRLIRLLDRAGDRAAALAEYARLTGWLRSEFDIEPSPETVALVGRVRERRSVSAEQPDRRVAVRDPDRPRSIAVLPFEDLGGGAEPDVVEGVGGDVLTALSRVRGVRVVSRTSVRRFASKPPASVGEVRDLLGVDYVLEGGVQLRGDRIRITVQLIDAVLDSHVWAEVYDRSLTDVFAIQTDVALRVARALEAELSPREHERLRHPPTTSLTAWRLYLKGREIWRQRSPEESARAAGLFRRALEEDGRFARAWVGLADACLVLAATGRESVRALLAEAKHALDRAAVEDPGLGETHATRGLVATFLEPDAAVAGREYRRAVELSPGYATAHQWYGNWLCGYGQIEEGLSELELALGLDPLAPAVSDSLGMALYHAGRLDQAEAQLRQTLELDPGFWRSHVTLALCRAAAGDLETAADELVSVWTGGGYGADPEEARLAQARAAEGPTAVLEYLLQSVRRRTDRVPGIRTLEIVMLALLGRFDDAMDAIGAARADGVAGFTLMYAPVLDPLAGTPRFVRLMEDIGLLLPRWQ